MCALALALALPAVGVGVGVVGGLGVFGVAARLDRSAERLAAGAGENGPAGECASRNACASCASAFAEAEAKAGAEAAAEGATCCVAAEEAEPHWQMRICGRR